MKHDDIHERDVTPKYWTGSPPTKDDFGMPIKNEFIDAPTVDGPWGFMTPASWRRHRMYARLGTGYGQRYKKQSDGRWLKVEG